MSALTRQTLGWLFFAGLFYGLFLLKAIVLPFILAATLAYLLSPLVNLLEIRGLRHSMAALLVFFGFFILLGVGLYGIVDVVGTQALRAAREWSVYVGHFQEIQDRLQIGLARLPGVGAWLTDLDVAHEISTHGRSWMLAVLQKTPSLAHHILPIFEYLLLVPFLTFMFLSDGESFRKALIQWVPARHVEMVINLLVEMDTALGNYLRGMCLQALFMGLLAGIAYQCMGLHYSAQIGLWVALTSAVPLIGPISAAAAGMLVALYQWGTLAGLVKVLIVFMVIRLADDWFFHPMILRRAVHLHPLITVFSLMAGAHVAGFWGLLFAVPVVCMLKVTLEVLWQWYWSEAGQVSQLHIEASRIPLV